MIERVAMLIRSYHSNKASTTPSYPSALFALGNQVVYSDPFYYDIMSNPEQLFNSLKLEVLVPDEVVDLPEPDAGSPWIRKLETLSERPAAYFGIDNRTNSLIVF